MAQVLPPLCFLFLLLKYANLLGGVQGWVGGFAGTCPVIGSSLTLISYPFGGLVTYLIG